MKASINNFRGASRATFPIEKLTLIGGPNGAGKSSIAQALGAALTGNPLPVRGVAKSSAGCLVRSGTAAGSVVIENEGGNIVIDWPKGKVSSEGTPPASSPFAAGLASIVAMSPKDKAETLAQYLDSEPTREDLEAELKGVGLDSKNMDKLWELIEAMGWDGAHDQSKEKGAKLKGQWEEWTKERYGAKKAETWLPEDWAADLDGASEDDLKARGTDAQDSLEAAIAADAVNGSEMKALEDKAARIDELKGHQAEASKVVESVRKAKESADEVLNQLPTPEAISMACPKCSVSLRVAGGKLVEATNVSEKVVEQQRKAIDKATAALRAAEDDLDKALGSLNQISRDLKDAEAAAKELEKRRAAAAGVKGGDVDAARNELAEAMARLKAWQAKTAADNRHYNIQVNQKIVDALASDGVRLTKLEKALGKFNKTLNLICKDAGWQPVNIDKTLDAHLGGTPYFLLSKSERYRVRVALQLAMAHMDESAAIVIDGADILVDKALRNGLIKTVLNLNIPTVICMALNSADDLPDLAARGLGSSFWMGTNGVLMDPSGVVAE